MKISKVLQKYDTDKHKNKKRAHCYGIAYDQLFRPYDRLEEHVFLEIGIYYGESLKAWREYFPNADIIGLDIEDYVDKKIKDVRYVIQDINDYKPIFGFDIVIDDGSHKLKDVLKTIENIKLNPGGIMIIEDVQRPNYWYKHIKPLADKFKYSVETIDLRSVNGQHDDYLIVLRNYGL